MLCISSCAPRYRLPDRLCFRLLLGRPSSSNTLVAELWDLCLPLDVQKIDLKVNIKPPDDTSCNILPHVWFRHCLVWFLVPTYTNKRSPRCPVSFTLYVHCSDMTNKGAFSNKLPCLKKFNPGNFSHLTNDDLRYPRSPISCFAIHRMMFHPKLPAVHKCDPTPSGGSFWVRNWSRHSKKSGDLMSSKLCL